MVEVSVRDAGQTLAERPGRAATGEQVTIIRDGEAVAPFSPVDHPAGGDAGGIIAELRELRRGTTHGGVALRGLIEEGRR